MRLTDCATACGLFLLMATQAWAVDGPHYTVRFLNGQYPKEVRTLAFSPDGSTLAVSTAYGEVTFVRTRDGEAIAKFDFSPFSMAYSSDGSRVLMISESKRQLLHVKEMTGVEVEVNQEPGFVGIEFEPKNGKWLVRRLTPGGAAERSKRILVDDEIIGIGEGAGDAFRMRDARGLRAERLLELIKGPAGTSVRLQVIHHGELEPHSYPLQRLARRNVGGTTAFVVPEQRKFTDNVAWCMFKDMHQFNDASTGRVISELRTAHVNNLGLHALSVDSRRFAVLGDTKEGLGVEVFDITSRDRLLYKELPIWETPDIRGNICYDLAFTPDGRRLLIGTWDTAEVLNLTTGTVERSIALDAGARQKKAPRARGFAAAAVTSIADSLGLDEDSETRGNRVVEKLAVSARGILATGSPFGEVKLWDLASGKFLESMPLAKDEDDGIERIAFSPDGKWLAYYGTGVLHLVNVEDVQVEDVQVQAEELKSEEVPLAGTSQD